MRPIPLFPMQWGPEQLLLLLAKPLHLWVFPSLQCPPGCYSWTSFKASIAQSFCWVVPGDLVAGEEEKGWVRGSLVGRFHSIIKQNKLSLCFSRSA